jgi:hypothetical protein
MSYLVRMLAVLAMAIFAGCGVTWQTRQLDLAEYPHRYGDFDYHYAWKTVGTDGDVAIEGVMKNVRSPYIDGIWLKVERLDKEGNVASRGIDFPMPQRSAEGDVSSFRLLLKGTPTAGDRYRFTIGYGANEGDQQRLEWVSIYQVDALSGTVIGPEKTVPDRW